MNRKKQVINSNIDEIIIIWIDTPQIRSLDDINKKLNFIYICSKL